MPKKAVTVQGGSNVNYKINIDGSKFKVVHDVGWSGTSIGETRSLEDAFTLIRSHSGREIKSIKDI